MSAMTTPDFIIALFYAVDQEMLEVPKHPDAKLYPSEVVTLALLHAIKGGGTRAVARPWCRGNPSREAGDSRACKARRWSLILAGFGRLALCHA
jgi:hypothetical protein